MFFLGSRDTTTPRRRAARSEQTQAQKEDTKIPTVAVTALLFREECLRGEDQASGETHTAAPKPPAPSRKYLEERRDSMSMSSVTRATRPTHKDPPDWLPWNKFPGPLASRRSHRPSYRLTWTERQDDGKCKEILRHGVTYPPHEYFDQGQQFQTPQHSLPAGRPIKRIESAMVAPCDHLGEKSKRTNCAPASSRRHISLVGQPPDPICLPTKEEIRNIVRTNVEVLTLEACTLMAAIWNYQRWLAAKRGQMGEESLQAKLDGAKEELKALLLKRERERGHICCEGGSIHVCKDDPS